MLKKSRRRKSDLQKRSSVVRKKLDDEICNTRLCE